MKPRRFDVSTEGNDLTENNDMLATGRASKKLANKVFSQAQTYNATLSETSLCEIIAISL